MGRSRKPPKTVHQTLTYPDGSEYTGEIVAGLRHGTGKMTFPNNEKYEGEWLNDQKHGRGVFCYANGELYQGEW